MIEELTNLSPLHYLVTFTCCSLKNFTECIKPYLAWTTRCRLCIFVALCAAVSTCTSILLMHYTVYRFLQPVKVTYNVMISDWEIFMLQIICVKIFRSFTHSAKFLNGLWLQYGWVPGEFLVFSPLPGIRRARDRWLLLLIGHLPRGLWLACKLIHWSLPCNFIFRVLNFCGWSRQ